MGGVDKQYLVSNEAMALMSIMRKSNRWVHSGISAILGSEDEPLAQRMGLRSSAPSSAQKNDLLQGFSPLCNAKKAPTPLEMVTPFLKVVQSPSTSGTLTLRALVSVDKILTHVLDENSENLGLVLYRIAVAVTHCRFEANDHAENDAVLHQIMAVMTTIIVGPLGKYINNQGLSEVMETCLSMACHMRRGELLLRNARLTLTRLIIAAFKRMPLRAHTGLELPEKLPQLSSPLREAVSLESRSQTPVGERPPPGPKFEEKIEEKLDTPDIQPSKQDTAPESPQEPSTPVSYDPYDSNGLIQVYQVMISLLEPSPKYTDKTKLMILQLLCHVFETAGGSMTNDSRFVELTSSTLFKHISQILRSNTPVLVAETLRLFNLIVETSGDKYVLHFQFVLTYLLRCLTPLTDLPRDENIDSIFYDGVPSRPKCVKLPHTNMVNGPAPVQLSSSKSPEIREIMVEAIARMVHTENFFTKLFVYYDCDVQQHNLCEDLIGFLCRNAYPDTATWSTPSVPPLCLESLLCFLSSVHDQVGNGTAARIESLLQVKSHKGVEITATELFNEKPAKGIKYAIENKVIDSDSPAAIAEFLFSSQRLNGATLGEYLAKETKVYNAFLENFDFTNQRIDEALRELLMHFRLPGESALIEKLVDALGDYYINQPHDNTVIKSKDAAFVLSYAIIMLHTNLYNPQVKEKEKMSLASFKSQLKGVNENSDFDQEYLDEIYDTLSKHEMIFPSEHDNDESFEHGWNDLQLALGSWNIPAIAKVDVAINNEIFNITWKPIVSTLAFIFATATDDLVFSRVISGIQRIASIASSFGTESALDHIIECLGRISLLSSGDLACPNQNVEVKIARENGKHHSVIVSDLSMAFGSDLKAQMAAITLFRIIHDIREASIGPGGWEIIARTLTNLYLYDLIEPIQGMARIKPCYTFEWSNSGKNVGIFSALSSYLTSTSDTPPEPSEDDVDAALSAQDCIKICNIKSVIHEIKTRVTDTAILGIEAAMPNSVDGDKYYPAILFLLQLLAKSVQESSSPQYKQKVLDFLLRLSKSAGQGNAEFSGSLTNLLLEVGSVEDAELDVRAMPYFIDSLLEHRHNSPKVWVFLSEAPLETIKNKEKLHQFVTNKDNHRKEALGAIFKTLVKVVEDHPPALDILYELKEEQVKTSDEFFQFLEAAILPCTVANGGLRERALDKLQSVLQSYNILTRYKIEWQSIFTRGLIPVCDLLLKPQVFKRDPKHMDATRQRSASIMCKTFLVYAMRDNEHMLETWLKILNVMDRLLSSRKQPSLHEGIAEMIKNVILVLDMSEKGTPEFWEATKDELKDWMPELVTVIQENQAKRESKEAEKERKADTESKEAEKETDTESKGAGNETDTESKGAGNETDTESKDLKTGDKK